MSENQAYALLVGLIILLVAEYGGVVWYIRRAINRWNQELEMIARLRRVIDIN